MQLVPMIKKAINFKYVFFLLFGFSALSAQADTQLGLDAGLGISDSIKSTYPTGNAGFHPPGVQVDLGFSVTQNHLFEKPSFLGARLGTHLQIDVLLGLPYFRTILSWQSPGFWLAGKMNLASKNQEAEFHGLFFIPFTARGVFTAYGKQPYGPSDSTISNSYGLGSVRVGYIGKIQKFLFGLTSGLEAGYVKASGEQAPFAGFVIGPQAEFQDQLTEEHGIGFRMETDVHLNVLRALHQSKRAQHGITLAADLHYRYRQSVEAGFKMQLSILNVSSSSQPLDQGTPIFYFGPFARWLL